MTSTVSQKRPQAIRKVTKYTGKTGHRTPKVAVDKRTRRSAERIKAMQPRPCDSVDCPWPNHVGHSRLGVINGGTHYVRITEHDMLRRMGGRPIPLTKDYHPDCVPAEDRPLIRLLFGYRWVAQTCVSQANQVNVRRFTEPEAWQHWLRKNYPDMMRQGAFVMENNNGMQHGTGYHWSMLTRYHGRLS